VLSHCPPRRLLGQQRTEALGPVHEAEHVEIEGVELLTMALSVLLCAVCDV
jgi:hypothetical protein